MRPQSLRRLALNALTPLALLSPLALSPAFADPTAPAQPAAVQPAADKSAPEKPAAAAAAGRADEAAARATETLVRALMEVRKGADGKLAAADEAANRALFLRLDTMVDREALVGVPLEPHRTALSAAQLEQVRTLFWGILRTITYTDTGRFFAAAKWSLKPAQVEGARVAVPVDTYLPEEDERTEITFVWDTAGAQPRLQDLSFDGASLVKDYQNQFGRILAKDGAEGLVKMLSARFEKETAKHGKVD